MVIKEKLAEKNALEEHYGNKRMKPSLARVVGSILNIFNLLLFFFMHATNISNNLLNDGLYFYKDVHSGQGSIAIQCRRLQKMKLLCGYVNLNLKRVKFLVIGESFIIICFKII